MYMYVYIYIFSTSLSLVGNLGHLTWVRHCSRKSSATHSKSSATHSCQCVQYLHVSKKWYGCQCLGFLTCAQMLMLATAHRGLYRQQKCLHWTLTLGEKSLAASRTQICIGIMPSFSVGRSTNWAISASEIAASETQVCISIMPGFSVGHSTNWAISASEIFPESKFGTDLQKSFGWDNTLRPLACACMQKDHIHTLKIPQPRSQAVQWITETLN